LEGGNITMSTPGSWTAKGAIKQMMGGGSKVAEMVKLPDSRAKLYDEQIRAINELTGDPIEGLPYKIETESGDIFYGITDADGRTERVATLDVESIKVFWGELPVSKSAGGEN
jgi:type VI secretion system secreted protein VgrG